MRGTTSIDAKSLHDVPSLVGKAFTSTVLPELIKTSFLPSHYFRVFQHNRPKGELGRCPLSRRCWMLSGHQSPSNLLQGKPNHVRSFRMGDHGRTLPYNT